MSGLDLLHAVPRLDIGLFPTPLHPMKRLEQELGHPGIWIKRDDLNGIGPGGNKIRSLEYLLAEAAGQGCDTVLAAGPLQSNLCSLTAAACAKLGLACILVLNGDRPAQLTGNLLLNDLLGAQVHYLGQVSRGQREAAIQELCAEVRKQGGSPYVILNGATTGRGALGYTRAVPELMDQCSQMGLENLTLYAPAGNGGVAAGLVLGNWLAGSPFRIVVVSVEYDYADTCAHITETMAESAEILGCALPPPPESLCRITAEFRGDGWGCDTPSSRAEVLRLARMEGILSENIYNSKVMVAMETEIRQGKADGNVCFLHTGGIGSLYAQYC